MNHLIDEHGRRIRKLRVSLTDRCNLRCHYCMPLNATFMEEKHLLSSDHMATVIRELCDLGLEEVRLTGGEPLVSKNFRKLAEVLATLPLKKIGLTTNGVLLDEFLPILKEKLIHHLNISLDSLNEENFRRITSGNHFRRVLSNIKLALSMNLHIKLNVVAMRGVNDHEIFDFVDFSSETGIEVRFLEVMRVGYACRKQEEQFIPASEIISRLQSRYNLKSVQGDSDSTSFNYHLSSGAQIGFIASESQAFCGKCSRWRLSADGKLRACLFKDEGISVKETTIEDRAKIYKTLLGMKPVNRPLEVTHQMNTIGG